MIRIALAGNPNSGKTTLFNALTGSNQYVGNWPGVTVEKKEGRLKGRKDVTVTDLPGIYSLSPHTPEEVVARNYLIDERPDVILNIVDGSNLERNLFLTTQLTELGIPVVVAVNMIDVVRRSGDKIDAPRLAKELGCKVVEISALKGTGIGEAATAAVKSAASIKTIPMHSFSGGVEHTLAHIEEAVLHNLPQERQRFFAIKLFERDEQITRRLSLTAEQINHIEDDIRRREKELDDNSESIITAERYTYIETVIKDCVVIAKKGDYTLSDKIDNIVTNRYLALPIIAAVMFIVYFVSVTTAGAALTDWANDGLFGEGFSLFGRWIPGVPVLVGSFLDYIDCAAWLKSLVLDGVVSGVGAVLGFVPQIALLFTFLAFLEGCGYMARIAFVMDRVMRRFGLSGKAFIPILIGTGCGVPGIMASRTIENRQDRRIAIMTTTFMPCSAKLPIIAMITGALFGGAWWVAPSAYFVGMAAIVISGVALKRLRLFSGASAPFIMEMPAYHWPSVKNILHSVWVRGWSFVKRAGTIILLAAVLIWFAANLGWDNGLKMVGMNESFLAAAGGVIAPLFAPLGWGKWQAAVAMLTGLVAKENVVGTLGVLYGASEVTESGSEIWASLAANFSALGGYSFLVFNLLCAPCFAAMGAIRREMNSAKWFWIAIGYQTGFAYLAALIVYQAGSNPGTAAVLLALVIAVAFIIRRIRRYKKLGKCAGCEFSDGCVKQGDCDQ
jgi:ferrous iron transport protein B